MIHFSDIPWKIVYVWASVGTTILTMLAWPIVKLLKKRSRRCICKCWRVTRTHQMILNKHALNDGRHYHSYTFSECQKCTMTWLAKSTDKCFSWIELEWRRKRHKQEFIIDPDLFRKAGVPLPDDVITLRHTNLKTERLPLLTRK